MLSLTKQFLNRLAMECLMGRLLETPLRWLYLPAGWLLARWPMKGA